MLKVPGADGKYYRVVSWTTFKKWSARAILGYAILATAMVLGLYFFGKKSSDDLKDQINSYSRDTCLASLQKNSTIAKYNGFVNEAIKTRQQELLQAEVRGLDEEARIQRSAIHRYQMYLITTPTQKQCLTKIIK